MSQLLKLANTMARLSVQLQKLQAQSTSAR